MLFNDIIFSTDVQPFLADAAASQDGGGMTGIIIGSGSVGAICGVVGAWIRAKFARKVEGEVKANVPQPLSVELKDQFVTRSEFEKHVAENRGDHENIFNRLSANDKNVGRMLGLLEGIQGDLSLIKQKLFGGRK